LFEITPRRNVSATQMKASLVSTVFVAVYVTVGAEPSLQKTDLFEAAKGGYALYRIPGLAVTERGTVLAYGEARRTGRSDWDGIDILLRRSTDGGKSWSAPQKISDVPGPKSRNPAIASYKLARTNDVTYNNPVAIADRNGTVHFLFCLEYMRCFHLRSLDDGLTWSAPAEITSAFEKFRPEWNWKVLATGPGHGIQLKSGRLIVPVWLSTGVGGGNAHRPSVTATLFSDDHGSTWQGGEIAVPNTETWINPNETMAVQLADDRVMLNVRSESKTNRRLVTISPDGATHWSKPRLDEALLEPICMASLVRLSQKPASDRNRIIFANPANLGRTDGAEAPGKSRDRKNLSIRLSYDEGETWPVTKVLEPGSSGYSDLAVTKDGVMLCLYERLGTDGESGVPSARLSLARFNLEWLTDGKDGLK
jgi:sialidase-1